MTTSELPFITERHRLTSPAPAPQALAWHENALWMGSRDLRRIYQLDGATGKIAIELDAPGIPWAAASIGKAIRFTLGEGPNDDRYMRSYVPGVGFSDDSADRVACPDFTGSYLSYDGKHLYLSQWYKQRILQLDEKGNIVRSIAIGAEISGHTFADGLIYVLRGTEQNGESWSIARLDPGEETPQIEDVARMTFACRSLTFGDGRFWSNHRAGNEIVAFSLPN